MSKQIRMSVNDFPLNGIVVFRRRNSACINLIVVNANNHEEFIFDFFNQDSRYAKNLEKKYNLDFKTI